MASGGMFEDEEDARWAAVEFHNKHHPDKPISQPTTGYVATPALLALGRSCH